VRRAYIAKVGKPGELRALGVPVLEDKIVQHASGSRGMAIVKITMSQFF
jgi:hypothetical protein